MSWRLDAGDRLHHPAGDLHKRLPELQATLQPHSRFARAIKKSRVSPALSVCDSAWTDQRPGTRQQVREARRVRVAVSPFRAEQVPLWKNTIGISQLVVSQLVEVWV
jgi:hypothetical protein